MYGMALCAGGGALELGLEAAVPGYRTVVIVERESRAASCIVDRMEDATVGKAPIWDDVATFDGRPWRGVVDIITAGFPCQPFSVAGLQRGVADERHIWPTIARIIGECAPTWVYCENVPGLLATVAPNGRSAYEHVEGDLQAMGYRVEAGLFSAAETGAPHLRERVFILAHRNGPGREHQPERPDEPQGNYIDRCQPAMVVAESSVGVGHRERLRARRRASFESGNDVERAESRRPDGRARQPLRRAPGRGVARRPGEGLGDAEGQGLEDGRLRERPQPSSDLALFPPGRADECAWRVILAERPDLAPALKSDVRRVAHGMAHRVDRSRLAITGNGVVPLVAAHAFLALRARLAIPRNAQLDA